jgi:hypothetical protein
MAPSPVRLEPAYAYADARAVARGELLVQGQSGSLRGRSVAPPCVRRQRHGGHLVCGSASPLSARRRGSEDFAGRNERRLGLIAIIHDGAQLSL